MTRVGWLLVLVAACAREEAAVHRVQPVVAGAAFAPTIANPRAAPGAAPEGMVFIPGGEFSMGAADPRQDPAGGPDPMGDARPVHRVYIDGFWMDRTEVTNEQFDRFVRQTAYVTVAERTPRAADFPGAPPENLLPGSTVFSPPSRPVPLDSQFRWWGYVKDASWRRPFGPGSDLRGHERFPVVHIAYSRPRPSSSSPPAAG